MASTAIIASAPVYESLRQAIVTGAYRPGDVLDRRQLAAQFGVSPMPVRDALDRLDREGFVIICPRSKTVVAPIEVLAVFEAAFLRRAFLGSVARRLARGRDHHDLAPLRALREADRIGDAEFCATLSSVLGIDGAWKAVQPLLAPLERCAALAGHDPEREMRAMRSYRDILKRIEAADPAGAAQAMEAHLFNDLSGFAALRAAHPEMFGEV